MYHPTKFFFFLFFCYEFSTVHPMAGEWGLLALNRRKVHNHTETVCVCVCVGVGPTIHNTTSHNHSHTHGQRHNAPTP